MTKAQSRRRGREDILLEVRRIILRGEHSPLLKGKEGLKKRKSPDLTLTRQGINGDGKLIFGGEEEAEAGHRRLGEKQAVGNRWCWGEE